MGDKGERKRRVDDGSIVYDAEADTADVFRAVALALLQRIDSQAKPVSDLDPKGVHQMRIALRRLRAAIAIFAGLVAGDETERLKVELRWLTGRLAAARDLDVMLARLKRGRSAGDAHRADLLRTLTQKRKAAFETARKAVASPRFGKLLRAIRRWIDEGDWRARDKPPELRKGRDFAEIILAERSHKVMRRAKKLNRLTVEKRHRLRIAMKKLFYAIGFFEGLFTGDKERKRLKAFRKRLKRLLDDLGALNDAAVQGKLIIRLAPRSRANGSTAPAMPKPHRSARVRRLVVTSAEDGRKLSRAKPFWV
jgi:CHAD domain-containing protein